ncbi:hypothetical protein CK203_114585 [Vitis vinifera]|uniref:Uncharacterized protein n=1 Tax=Vitis vinifera TaxID=29760 RepID=A0A438CQE6_VITVI|nr:hypothetical protein CK203_114585 [Vitis vinifera]
MVTQPPIEALDFYQSMTTHRVRDPTVIHFTIDGHHGILGARHIAEMGIHTPISVEEGAPSQHVLYRCTAVPNIYPLQHMVQRRGALLEALFRISEGFFFGPHHLIMA